MQEHFNNEYLESDKFPKATFVGKISENFSSIITTTETEVSGILAIHGVSKQISYKAQVSKKEDLFVVKCKFPIVFKDYKVDEPAILRKSVSKDVEVNCLFYLK